MFGGFDDATDPITDLSEFSDEDSGDEIEVGFTGWGENRVQYGCQNRSYTVGESSMRAFNLKATEVLDSSGT